MDAQKICIVAISCNNLWWGEWPSLNGVWVHLGGHTENPPKLQVLLAGLRPHHETRAHVRPGLEVFLPEARAEVVLQGRECMLCRLCIGYVDSSVQATL